MCLKVVSLCAFLCKTLNACVCLSLMSCLKGVKPFWRILVRSLKWATFGPVKRVCKFAVRTAGTLFAG